jgi:hypothetical protein
MYICDNSACGVWLHKDCIIDDSLINIHKRSVEDVGGDSNGTTNGRKSKAKKPYIGKFSGKIVEDEASVKIEITDLRSGKGRHTWQEKLSCLKCGTELQR